MKGLEFNKVLSSAHGKGRYCKSAYVKMRKLKKIGKNERYQAFLSKSAVELAVGILNNFDNFQTVYSDEHLIVGFKPMGDKGRNSKYVGITGLLDLFDIKLGVEYEIKSNGEVLYFNSNQHK